MTRLFLATTVALLVLPFLFATSDGTRQQTQQYSQSYSMTLDPRGQMKLTWTPDYNNRQVIFHLEAAGDNWPPEEKQWIAVGFSDRGEWSGADICVGWRDWTDATLVQDGHVDANGAIRVDAKDDCRGASYERKKGGGVVLHFRRSFNTCDRHHSSSSTDEDYVIEDGTTHVVFASGPGPLYRIDGVKPTEERVGFQRTRLLKPPPAEAAATDEMMNSNDNNDDDGVRSLVIANQGVQVPGDETTYWCRVVRLPANLRRSKHHVVRFESAIEIGRESLVHHMEVFHCEPPRSDDVIPIYSGPCESPDRPQATRVCKRVLAAWAFGAGPFVYPPEAGLPLGGPDFNPYVMLEVHYNNPSLKNDWVDSSGVRLTYTKRLRPLDAGVMELGLEYTDKMAIPPEQKSFTLTGYCLPECTAVSLPVSGITIFGSQLHTHLLGTRVVTQHFRGRSHQLAELDRDNHYSTHFQEIRLLAKPVRVLPGDALLTTCWYDTTGQANVSLGGFSISDEMCVNYVHYFPRVDLEVCKSSIAWRSLDNYFGFLRKWEGQKTRENEGVSANYHAIDWTPLRAKVLSDYYRRAPVSMQCNQSSGERFPGDWEGLAAMTVPLPSLETVNNNQDECSD